MSWNQVGRGSYRKVSIYKNYDGGIEINVHGYASVATVELTKKETKKLIKVLKKALKGGE